METTYNNTKKKSASQDQQNETQGARMNQSREGQRDVQQRDQRTGRDSESREVSASEQGQSQEHSLSSIGSSLKTAFNSISLPEIAILGAAGFVVWKNRAQIQKLFETNGVDVPFFNGDMSSLVQSGLSMITGQKAQGSEKQLHS